MLSYFIYGLLLTGFVQPVTVHWTWSNGFLVYPPKRLNLPPEVYFRDYAGLGLISLMLKFDIQIIWNVFHIDLI